MIAGPLVVGRQDACPAGVESAPVVVLPEMQALLVVATELKKLPATGYTVADTDRMTKLTSGVSRVPFFNTSILSHFF